MKCSQIAVFLLMTSGLMGWGQTRTESYAQVIERLTTQRHPDLSTISMSVNRFAQEHATISRHQPHNWPGGGPYCQHTLTLRDTPGDPIGILRLQFVPRSKSDCAEEADRVAKELEQIIPNAETLFDPFIVSNSPDDSLAQRLTLETFRRHPDLLVLAFHVTAPGQTVNRVVGINEPKFLGRASDDVDQEVARTGKMIVQVIPSTHRMETHMPLRAADGSIVGTLVTVYLWHKEDEAPGLIARSMKIRDELQPRVPNLAALLTVKQPALTVAKK